MVIEVNKDIDRYQESVAMGLAAMFVLAVAGWLLIKQCTKKEPA